MKALSSFLRLKGWLGRFGKVSANSSPLFLNGQQLLAEAAAFHQTGQLREAETSCRKILEHEPGNAAALHMLGIIVFQNGNRAEAETLLRRAIALEPDNPAMLNHLGHILGAKGQFGEAHAQIKRALELLPGYAEAQNNRGCLFQEQGRLTEAEADFSAALTTNPGYVEALFNLANVQLEQGDLELAETSYRRALELRPDLMEAHNALGNLCRRRGRQQEAEKHYRQALALRPEHARANNDYGAMLVSQGRMAEAESCFRRAIQSSPHLLEAHNNLGELLLTQGKLADAWESIQEALQIRPNYPDGLVNLGMIYSKRGQPREAEASFNQAIELFPGLTKAYLNLGLLYNGQRRHAEAENAYRNALAIEPENPLVQYNLSIQSLLRGDYETGFAYFESRFAAFPDWQHEALSQTSLDDVPRWAGEDLAGRRLLVWAEQGLGDSLMMLRYLPLLKGRGAGEVLVFCEPALERLVRNIPGVSQVYPTSQQLPFEVFDLHCPMMSLPYLLGTRLDTIPDKMPYLTVPEELRDKWQARLAGQGGKKVGLVWAGSSTLRDDAKRSIPLHLFKPLLDIVGVRLISLQKGAESKQLAELSWDMANWMDECADFLDTAALVGNLDLVIAVDTAVAHLAGALGKPVWLLNRHESEWRWGLEREDSPWYPTMRIFNQHQPGDWFHVIQRVASELCDPARQVTERSPH